MGTRTSLADLNRPRRRRGRYLILLIVIATVSALWLLRVPAAEFLVYESLPTTQADVAVVLNGPAKVDRLERAAQLYHAGLVKKIVFNGDRRSDAARRLYADGLQRSHSWDSYRRDILRHLKVPDADIIAISLPEAFDSISEARLLGERLIKQGVKTVVVTSSSSHTRRAGRIWSTLFADELTIYAAPTRSGDFQAEAWWTDARQAREFLWEWGAFAYLYWQSPRR